MDFKGENVGLWGRILYSLMPFLVSNQQCQSHEAKKTKASAYVHEVTYCQLTAISFEQIKRRL